MSHTGKEQGNQQTDPSHTDGTALPVGKDDAAKTSSRWKVPHFTPLVTLAAIWAITFTTLLAWGLYANFSAKPDRTDCPQSGPVSGGPSTAPSKPAQLKPRTAPVTAVPFARSRTIQFRQAEY